MNAPIELPTLLCQDCRHYQHKDGADLCTRSMLIDYVHGNHRHYSCGAERTSICSGDCGKQAQFFEPIIIARAVA